MALLIAIPHMVQDDGRLLDAYMRRVKGVGDPRPGGLLIAVDQSFHVLVALPHRPAGRQLSR